MEVQTIAKSAYVCRHQHIYYFTLCQTYSHKYLNSNPITGNVEITREMDIKNKNCNFHRNPLFSWFVVRHYAHIAYREWMCLVIVRMKWAFVYLFHFRRFQTPIQFCELKFERRKKTRIFAVMQMHSISIYSIGFDGQRLCFYTILTWETREIWWNEFEILLHALQTHQYFVSSIYF